jgi:hypothetical protein
MPDPIENYLSDTINLLIEEAKASSDKLQRLRASGPSPELEFEGGRSFGLFQAVSLLHSQLLGFNLDPTKVGFPSGFDPENELIK